MAPIINLNKYYDLLEVKLRRKPCQSSITRYLYRQKIYLDRKGKLQWKFSELPIIALTLPVITAGNLKASRLQCLSILFMSTSEMFREGVILPQRLHFCQSFINDRGTLNLLCFVAYSYRINK